MSGNKGWRALGSKGGMSCRGEGALVEMRERVRVGETWLLGGSLGVVGLVSLVARLLSLAPSISWSAVSADVRTMLLGVRIGVCIDYPFCLPLKYYNRHFDRVLKDLL